MIDRESLIQVARKTAQSAYARYSGFRVGAALLCTDGTIHVGFNVENRSYGLTVCAERTALFSALIAGKSQFTELAVVGIDSEYPLPPCGACRQVLSEFLGGEAPVHFAGAGAEIRTVKLGDLLPYDSLHEPT
jgi:cytidine deaminase